MPRPVTPSTVLIAEYGRFAGLAFLRIPLVADIGPQLVAFDPVHAKPDHHAIVKLGAATANGHREARDRLAICLSEAADGALAHALTEHSDDFNLLLAKKDIHGLDPCLWIGPKRDSGKTA
jgi:hypothetical protein